MNPPQETRSFSLAAVLTVTTGRLLCDIGQVYDVLGYMTGEPLMTHQLPRASRECEGPILAQHPDLAAIEVPEWANDAATVERFLLSLRSSYGESRVLQPLASDDHTSIDPIEELRMMRPDLPIVVVAPVPDSTPE